MCLIRFHLLHSCNGTSIQYVICPNMNVAHRSLTWTITRWRGVLNSQAMSRMMWLACRKTFSRRTVRMILCLRVCFCVDDSLNVWAEYVVGRKIFFPSELLLRIDIQSTHSIDDHKLRSIFCFISFSVWKTGAVNWLTLIVGIGLVLMVAFVICVSLCMRRHSAKYYTNEDKRNGRFILKILQTSN